MVARRGAPSACSRPCSRWRNWLARLYVAQVFFLSGLTKLRDWDVTLALFQDRYHVPLLDPVAAAWLGTGGEIVLPVLLALGLAGRFAAAGLCRCRTPSRSLSLAEIAPAALQQHQFWGSLLAGCCCCGGRGDGRSMRSSCRAAAQRDRRGDFRVGR